jgi:hypothetical protein
MFVYKENLDVNFYHSQVFGKDPYTFLLYKLDTFVPSHYKFIYYLDVPSFACYGRFFLRVLCHLEHHRELHWDLSFST